MNPAVRRMARRAALGQGLTPERPAGQPAVQWRQVIGDSLARYRGDYDEPAVCPPPAVSVVMPCYNMAHRGLSRAIESVQAQTWQDWELLIIDDGSTDNSGAIAEFHAARDPRIRVRHQTNGGLSVARNAGYWLARGEFIAHLDADDEYLPEKLELQMRELIAHPECGVSFGQRRMGSIVGFNWPQPFADGWEAVRDRNSAPCQSVMLRRSLLQTVGGNIAEAPFTNSAQDWEQWIRAFAISEASIIRQPLYILNRHGDSLSDQNYGEGKEIEAVAVCRQRAAEMERRRQEMRSRRTRLLMVGADGYSRGQQVVMYGLLHGLNPEEFEVQVMLGNPQGELMGWFREHCDLVSPSHAKAAIEWADVVHLHYHGWTAAREIYEAAEKLLITEHSTMRRYEGRAARRIQVWVGKRPGAQAELPRSYMPSGVEVQNAAFWEEGEPEADLQELGLPEGPIILALHPMQEGKGILTFLEMAGHLHRWRRDLAFVVCGVRSAQIDRDRPRAEEMVKKLRAEVCSITVLPPQPRQFVKALCERAALVVQLSLTEAQPLAVIEAQERGTPVVVTAVGGMMAIVYCGAVVGVMQPHEAAVEAKRLIGRRLSDEERANVAWRHDQKRVVSSYSEVYRAVRLGI